MKFSIANLIPTFILADRNGMALSKAIERGMRLFAQTVEEGLNATIDVERMPEWRLDEMAWEYNCFYDYAADVESKRAWISDAVPLYASYGTLSAVQRFLDGYFGEVEVEENPSYGGEPYHFRVTVSGTWTSENEALARRAIEITKSARSVLDDLSPGGKTDVRVGVESGWYRFPYIAAGQYRTGELPQEAYRVNTDDADVKVYTETDRFATRYPATGELSAGQHPEDENAN